MAAMAPLGSASPGHPLLHSGASRQGRTHPRQPGYSVGVKLPKEGQSSDGSWTQCACLEMSCGICSLHPPASLLYFLPFPKKSPKYLRLLGSRSFQSGPLGKLLEYLKVVDNLPGKQSILSSPVEITDARRDQLCIKFLLTIESLPMGQLCSTAEQLGSAGQE